MTIDKTLHIALIICMAALLPLLQGCSPDEIASPEPRQGEVTLRVPFATGFQTRGDDTDELKYSSLVFFAFPVDNDGKTVAQALPTDESPLPLKEVYKKYSITLTHGKYRFYLVANHFNDEEFYPQSEEDLLKELMEYDENFDGTIPASGLPMSARHTDFFIKSDSGTTTGMTESGFEYDGNDINLYADLTFGCAKVSVTVKDHFGDITGLSGLTAHHLSESAPLIRRAGHAYGKIQSVTPALEADADGVSSGEFTLYLPERFVEEATGQTKLTFNAGNREVTIPLGEKTGADVARQDGSSPLPAETDKRELHRGKHYSYVLNALGRVELEVKDWSPIEIASSLHGVCFLHVDQQECRVTAGEVSRMWFDSDAEDVHVESPVYVTSAGTSLSLYEYEINDTNDSIRVWVNPEIRSTEFDAITNNTDKYNYFHIVAGPIHKRITVTPLLLKNYLTVTPQHIPIDVRVRIASGEYSGDIPVEINTNYPKISIARLDGWDNLPSEEWGAGISESPIKLIDKEGNRVLVGEGYQYDVEDGHASYRLHFSGLNSNLQTWNEVRRLTFTVSGIDDNGVTKTVPVTISILPNLLTYKIHFRASGWSKPHIYVYQCLEFPGDWHQTHEGEDLASKPIGYKFGNNYLASLEYSFTGRIAFKGWDTYLNRSALYDENGQPVSFDGSKNQGFFVFKEATHKDCSWSAEGTSANLRYFTEMDFCEDFRNEIADLCPSCVNTPNPVYPGIQMKKEDDDWWMFELTGVATPGKALIMFSDDHGGSSINRFPKSANSNEAVVGLPLFDFQQREGWLDYNGIYDDRITNIFYNNPVKYRIYWPAEIDGNDYPGIWLWFNGADNVFIGNVFRGDYGNYFGTLVGKYYCYEIVRLKDFAESAVLHGLVHGKSHDGQKFQKTSGWGSFSDFTESDNGFRCAYLDTSGNLHSGKPADLK